MEAGLEEPHGLHSPFCWLRIISQQKQAVHDSSLLSLETYKIAPVNFGLKNNLKSKESDTRARGV